MEKYSIELMLESKRIFLVTTPEIPPLHLARQRLNFLRDLDTGDRINVLLNRWSRKSAVSKDQIEDLLEAPVYESFPNSYAEVHSSLVAGAPIDPTTEIGRRYKDLAHRILQVDQQKGVGKSKRGFLNNFGILAGRR
jgi:pilus assembly protein CpaE